MQFVSIECGKQILKQRQEKRAKENCANMGKKARLYSVADWQAATTSSSVAAVATFQTKINSSWQLTAIECVLM